jgi:hypothetical protein
VTRCLNDAEPRSPFRKEQLSYFDLQPLPGYMSRPPCTLNSSNRTASPDDVPPCHPPEDSAFTNCQAHRTLPCKTNTQTDKTSAFISQDQHADHQASVLPQPSPTHRASPTAASPPHNQFLLTTQPSNHSTPSIKSIIHFSRTDRLTHSTDSSTHRLEFI